MSAEHDEDLAAWNRLRTSLSKHTTTKAIAKGANLPEAEARDRLEFLHHAGEVLKCSNDCWRFAKWSSS